jgi:hypothetical protein
MREVPVTKRRFDSPGLVFHVASLTDAIPDAPRGIWIENDLVSNDPILRKRIKNDVVYRFYALNPKAGIVPEAPLHVLLHVASQSMPGGGPRGNDVGLDLYGECIANAQHVSSLIEQAITSNEDPPALTE